MWCTIVLCGCAYLMGSLSPAVMICRWAGIADPRIAGSKNPGTTNVLRLGGKKLAVATLLCDMLKGIIPVAIALSLNAHSITLGWVAVAVVLGHLYPIFYKFKGGKGVATALGALLALSWPVGLMLIFVWILMAWLFHFASLASLISVVVAPFCMAYIKGGEQGMVLGGFMAVIALLIVGRHKANIQRLIHGLEPKIGGM